MKALLKNIGMWCWFVIVFNSYSQIICHETKEEITLSNGNSVYVYQEKNTSDAPIYYYVPTQVKLSQNKGKPEYSFLEFKNPGSTTADGAILHLLITWGLDVKEITELKQCIKNQFGNDATLSGAIYLDNQDSQITISTTTKAGKTLNNGLKSKGTPPTLANGKMAMSFQLKKEEVKIISDALKHTSGFDGTVLRINYSFNTNTCNSPISLAKKNNISVEGHLKNWF